MGEIIFARPRWEYGSYSDYWKLITLSGYPLIFIDEIDPQSDNTYIFSQPPTDWHHGYENPRARIIYWAIEWYLDVDYSVVPGVELWAADAWYAARIGAKYVPMGSHPALSSNPGENCEKVYDVVTLWAPSNNRYHAEDLINRHGLTRAPNAWGDERHRILSQSRVMACVHQYPAAACAAPQRWALAAAYSLPVISETLAGAGILDSVTVQVNLEDIGVVIENRLKPANAGNLIAMGRELHNLLCVERTFRKGIEAAL